MATESKRRAVAKYNDKTYAQLNIRVKKGEREIIAAAASAAGESLNSFVVKAVFEKIERES